MTVPTIVAGIDISKSQLDVHLDPGGRSRCFDNDTRGRGRLLEWLLEQGVQRVVLEPTGRYHRRLHRDLHQAGLEEEEEVVNPLRSRRFAEAVGQWAKTDRVDAAMLARYGHLRGLQATPPQPEPLVQLRDLLGLRRQWVRQCVVNQRLKDQWEGPQASQPLSHLLKGFDRYLRSVEAEIAACIAADEQLARRAEIIRSIPGFGPGNAASLVAEMPELGRLQPRQAAALIGLAPFADESGRRRGGRHIRGGREHPRHLLFMAATTIVRCNPAMREFFQRLRDRGKPHKVAMVAVMRKLIVLVNTLLREDRLYQPQPPVTLAMG